MRGEQAAPLAGLLDDCDCLPDCSECVAEGVLRPTY